MKKELSDFQNQRMELFKKLVKEIWAGELTQEELREILAWLQEEYDYQAEDLSFLKDQLRVSMGLEPNQKGELSTELAELQELSRIEKPIINKVEGVCQPCIEESEAECDQACKYETLQYRRNQGAVIVNDKCLNCGKCISSCPFGALADKIEFIPLVELLKESSTEVYAAVAPSIAGQLGNEVSLGQLRTALKLLGFEDLVEVALFADLLTIKEAFEFDQLVAEEGDFFLTSCCCPVWIRLVKSKFPKLFARMSPSVSPMIAAGRVLKELYPEAKVVFIGPCIAKKAEAKADDLAGAIDFVLTFRELAEVLTAVQIKPERLPAAEKDQASFAGRVYARSGGVSFAVKTIVNRIAPQRLIKFKAQKVAGTKECQQLLESLVTEQNLEANFIEGMGCVGGCVGGPRTNLEVEAATKSVNQLGEDSLIMTPFDNLNVVKILEQLGIKEVVEVVEADLLSREEIKKTTN
ncbi:[Fe-Fe] hydrogenase large subunit C-terminal domain-containing protein [Fuchsiella alkaliacetigena]|uniref:[Fe-Fe] hydrogenase large subunit C-terminal domain-containing protein n=1 Tax=Fuchsiella alkaliacetigena TaxID=957042 RepID=UPI00200B84D4|nr:[Fe-Fe] hydrogenase large subunit C-terminal domain-containing protein [Fuchsiella alkaliacetigena]MCK8823838.1 4Fe-4S binding protein [Fuchsiella alkaliacetigena]